ncbi:DUF6065 family protein [Roseomonas sp. NAR14]|uniref:DUF6065 family protein n=1 Tax=Roseomonas acroporae TaxID=2937791 RepID=A0A9X1Y745_9PROT|nr:DUF6065 family protein [Roseomonas acroporae]MCK8784731.1 DUF6065 family protein [Roseomonas acroporae]
MPDPGQPLVTFFRAVESVLPPQPADRSAAGTLPTRATRYCDAVTSAAGFGWHLFAPLDLSLLWDGEEIFWTYDELDDWLPLSAAQFPHFSDRFDAAAPPHLRGCAPPFLTALPEPGVVQVWTGLLARSQPGWSLLLRAPANLPPQGGCVPFEGIVETDHWFGPLFTNLRLTRTDSPVRLRADYPLLQAQPLPRAAYHEETMRRMAVVPDLAGMGEAEWSEFHANIVVPNLEPDAVPGRYAVAARRRRRGACPFSGAVAAAS